MKTIPNQPTLGMPPSRPTEASSARWGTYTLRSRRISYQTEGSIVSRNDVAAREDCKARAGTVQVSARVPRRRLLAATAEIAEWLQNRFPDQGRPHGVDAVR